MLTPDVLSVAREFSKTPGPRAEAEGPHSGEKFLRTRLLKRFLDAQRQGRKLLVDLDGTEGYATSFLEAAFGGLARNFPAATVLDTLEFKSSDEPYLVSEIKQYIADARKAA
ncbi:MAG TPA: STAS-like domain-containing protein [Terriglobales bacterium]|nr:STAS-like domain-containing protein [Terriglobales bacterium]